MAISLRPHISVGHISRLVWFVVVSVTTFALYNYPRSWWQELICATSLLWAPLCVFGIFARLIRLKLRTRSLLAAVIFGLNVMCVVKVVTVTLPYIYAPAKVYPTLSYSRPTRIALVDVTERGEEISARVASHVEGEAPDVLIVARYADTPIARQLSEKYPHKIASSVVSERAVEVFSKTPITPPSRTEYGYGALPGVLGGFETSDGVRFQLGAMDLEVSSSQRAFNESRLTSRRLASALKYSVEPRIVVGAFRASITSQLVDMYVDQLKLRSIFFNSGVSRLARSLVQSIFLARNINAFTSRKIEVQDPIEFSAEGRGFSSLAFTVRVPGAPR